MTCAQLYETLSWLRDVWYGAQLSWALGCGHPQGFVPLQVKNAEESIGQETITAHQWKNSEWVRAYDAALLEPEMQKVPMRIEAAHVAIDSRLRELSYARHSYDQQEFQALNHAISALRVSLAVRKRTSEED